MLNKKSVDDINVKGQKVLVRCDFNVPLQDGKITDGAFAGSGCAVSQASADMMLDLIMGKTKEEALKLSDLFLKMIHGEATPEEIEQLEEASSLQDISHMPARVKCAVLGWHTMEEMLDEKKTSDDK